MRRALRRFHQYRRIPPRLRLLLSVKRNGDGDSLSCYVPGRIGTPDAQGMDVTERDWFWAADHRLGHRARRCIALTLVLNPEIH